jgi:hypothetical protein
MQSHWGLGPQHTFLWGTQSTQNIAILSPGGKATDITAQSHPRAWCLSETHTEHEARNTDETFPAAPPPPSLPLHLFLLSSALPRNDALGLITISF